MTKFYLTVDNGAPYGRNRMTGFYGAGFESREYAESIAQELEENFGWDDIKVEETNDSTN